MKEFGNFILGFGALVGVFLLIVVLVAVVGLLFYGFGWAVGWCIHIVVGPDIIFGITFEQFIGVAFLVAGIIGTGRSAGNQKDIKKKIDEGIQAGLKEYRGY